MLQSNAGSLALITVLLLPLGCLNAAEEFQEVIPIEVAEALFSFGASGNLRVYADIVDEFPNFSLPAQFEVLGSSVRAGAMMTLALRTPLDEDSARTALIESFANEDWIEMPEFGPPRAEYGFVSANQPAPPSYKQLCHDDFGQMTMAYSEGEAANVLTLNTGNAFGGDYRSCAERIQQIETSMARSSQRGMGISQYMPLLIVPEDARQGRMPFINVSGSSSSGNSAETDTSFMLEWELDALYEHLADQIVEQGWTLDAESLGSVTASGNWTRQLEEGANLVLRLDVVSQQEDRFDLTLRVEGPGGRRGWGLGILQAN